MSKWKPPKHGDDSKYIHVRLRSPTTFSKMRTLELDGGLKQVYGKKKGSKDWKPQNIMIPKKAVVIRGNRISITSKKMRERLKKHGIRPTNIRKLKSGGSADYSHPASSSRGK